MVGPFPGAAADQGADPSRQCPTFNDLARQSSAPASKPLDPPVNAGANHHFNNMVAVHLRAPLIVTEAVAPTTIRQGCSSVINAASASGHRVG